MRYDDLLTLIPSHSLEDFPSELGDPEAESLLNSFAVPWHPVLLANAKVLPRWHRADDPPDSTQKRLVFVPTHCESWLPAGWAERIVEEGCVAVRNVSDRAEMIAQALAPLGEIPAVDPDLTADFLALGFTHLQIELLTRKMRNFSSLDEVHLRREAVAAAEAAVAGDNDAARARLKECFEVLAEGRERFYPVDCYLLDLCLIIPKLGGAELQQTLSVRKPISLLASAVDLVEIADKHPETASQIAAGCEERLIAMIGGDLSEQPVSLMALNSVLWQMQEAQRIFQEKIGHTARVWGRRRFGLFPQWPQILKKAGFTGAIHVVLDDGFYPDHEYSKFRWEGIEHSSIEAVSRIPLAADAATSYLRFPTRMAESMDHDHTAAVFFARWPDVSTPFFEDLRRMQTYAPVLGKFVTLNHFFEQTTSATTTGSYRPREYLTPFLFQAVAREEINPLSRFAELVNRRHRLDRAMWLQGICALLTGSRPGSPALRELERASESLGEEATAEAIATQNTAIEALSQSAAEGLAKLVLKGAGDRPGFLLFNPLGFQRTVAVDLDWHGPRPIAAEDRVRVQWTERHAQLVVELPGAGFAWVPSESGGPLSANPKDPPLAEPNLLQNELFEVHLNSETGGIARIKGHGRSPNRLSQQLNYRFSRERTFDVKNGDVVEQVKSHYAEMKVRTSEVTASGPTLGEIVTTGDIVDQKNGDRLAEYRQTVRVWRGRPVIEVTAELTIDRMPDAEPWHNYFAARFAWHDETAALSYSGQSGVHPIADERIESPYFIEIASTNARTTLLPLGMPFHRKTGLRMLDSILVVPKEGQRRFRFVIAIDQDYPMQAALDAMVPAAVVPTRTGPPRGSASGWFFSIEPRNAQLIGLFPPVEPTGETAGGEASPSGCRMRLLETEGRPARARIRSLRNPKQARQVDLEGRTLCPLAIDGDGVLVDLTAYEIADVEILF